MACTPRFVASRSGTNQSSRNISATPLQRSVQMRILIGMRAVTLVTAHPVARSPVVPYAEIEPPSFSSLSRA
jgi:hypothetical protein